jgi:hypothetical protein
VSFSSFFLGVFRSTLRDPEKQQLTDLLGAASALGGASAVGHGRFGWLVDEVCLVDKENKGCTVFFGGVFF